jgi:phosphoenolpyruvate carboxykinase (ATP)
MNYYTQKNTWADRNLYDEKANELAKAFKINFEQFADYANEGILEALPKEILAK